MGIELNLTKIQGLITSHFGENFQLKTIFWGNSTQSAIRFVLNNYHHVEFTPIRFIGVKEEGVAHTVIHEFCKLMENSFKGKGCGNRLAPGQHWAFCGETDMGQTHPALCKACGGTFILRERQPCEVPDSCQLRFTKEVNFGIHPPVFDNIGSQYDGKQLSQSNEVDDVQSEN